MKNESKKRVLPAFPTEAEEAGWWYKNRKRLDKNLTRAARTGELKVLDRKTLMNRIARSKASRMISIRLPEGDIDLARRQAAKEGLPYQTFIKSLLHKALQEHTKAG